MWVYTEKGQQKAEEDGYFDRKAGQPAMLGYMPVKGIIAEKWEESGYIVWRNEHANKPKDELA